MRAIIRIDSQKMPASSLDIVILLQRSIEKKSTSIKEIRYSKEEIPLASLYPSISKKDSQIRLFIMKSNALTMISKIKSLSRCNSFIQFLRIKYSLPILKTMLLQADLHL